MHAKMTRDRKKCFIATIEKTIEDLENENNRMRSLLSKLAASKFSQLVTPVNSPKLTSSPSPNFPDDEAAYSPGADDGVDGDVGFGDGRCLGHGNQVPARFAVLHHAFGRARPKVRHR